MCGGPGLKVLYSVHQADFPSHTVSGGVVPRDEAPPTQYAYV